MTTEMLISLNENSYIVYELVNVDFRSMRKLKDVVSTFNYILVRTSQHILFFKMCRWLTGLSRLYDVSQHARYFKRALKSIMNKIISFLFDHRISFGA